MTRWGNPRSWKVQRMKHSSGQLVRLEELEVATDEPDVFKEDFMKFHFHGSGGLEGPVDKTEPPTEQSRNWKDPMKKQLGDLKVPQD